MAEQVTHIPRLVLPEGSEEAAQLWQTYAAACQEASHESDVRATTPEVNLKTGEVQIITEDGRKITPPTEEIGIPTLDELAEYVARLYEKGSLVSIDKLSRIPPLDAPLNPSWFGDSSEIQLGNVLRKVSMRASIIDDATLKEIEKRRKALRELLNKFSFRLGDNMRWMPYSSRLLFEAEIERINLEGQKLIGDLLKGDVDGFIASRKEKLKADINAMYRQLGKVAEVTEDVLNRVMNSLKERLTRAQSANFMPKLTYSKVAFSSTSNTWASPWGQAYSLLSEIAEFPRKALTDSFFFRGLRVAEDDLTDAMNVAEDPIVSRRQGRGVRQLCRADLDLLARVERSHLDARDKCDLVVQMLAGEVSENLAKALEEKEAKHEEEAHQNPTAAARDQ